MTIETTTDHAALDEIVDGLGAHAGEWWRCRSRRSSSSSTACDPGHGRGRRDGGRDPARQGHRPVDDLGRGGLGYRTVGVPAGHHKHAHRLARVQKGEEPISTSKMRTRPGGQTVVSVFPPPRPTRCCSAATAQRSGCSLECHLRTPCAEPRRCTGEGVRRPGVALVLGAGNVGTITTLDILHMLYTEGSVCVVKMNPVNDYLSPYYARIFGEFVERGWLRFVHGVPTSAATSHSTTASTPST